jgi:hypothetical protein
VVEVAAHGPRAIPKLRTLLFARERSGLYQPRCHVVEALTALGAHDALIEFLQAPRIFADPVENAGEEAVLNAAARGLRSVRDEGVFRLLLGLAETRRLAGAIEMLGTDRHPEALPCLVAALADDVARPVAEIAIKEFGASARMALVDAASQPVREEGVEAESSRRRRRAALGILLEMPSGPIALASRFVELMDDEDHAIAVLSCRLILICGTDAEKREAVQRLIELLAIVSWPLRQEIENGLVGAYELAGPLIEPSDQGPMPGVEDWSRPAEARRALRRIRTRAGS